MKKLLIALFASITLSVGVVSAVQAVPAPGNLHWGPPYVAQCAEGPCRVVHIADATGDPRISAQIRRWVSWMNYSIRAPYNWNLPVFLYYAGDPGQVGFAPGWVTIYKNDALVTQKCGTAPGLYGCSQWYTFFAQYGYGNHFDKAQVSFRGAVGGLSDVNIWNAVCHEMGHVIGLAHTTDPNSCMVPIQNYNGREYYYEQDDWNTLWNNYGHAPRI